MKAYVISYESQSTVNGERVGRVFVVDCGKLSPGSFSYSQALSKATRFSLDTASHLVATKPWRNAIINEVEVKP